MVTVTRAELGLSKVKVMPFVLWVPLFSLLILPQSSAEETLISGDSAQGRFQKTQRSPSLSVLSYLTLPASWPAKPEKNCSTSSSLPRMVSAQCWAPRDQTQCTH